MNNTIFIIDAAELSRVTTVMPAGRGAISDDRSASDPTKISETASEEPTRNDVIALGKFEIYEREEGHLGSANWSGHYQWPHLYHHHHQVHLPGEQDSNQQHQEQEQRKHQVTQEKDELAPRESVHRWIVAAVGGVSWRLDRETPSMRLGELTFAFQDTENPNSQLVVMFPANTSPELIGTLEAILEEVSMYRELVEEDEARSEERQSAESIAGQALENQVAELYSSKTATRISRVATAAASGISSSALWASDAMSRASGKLISGAEPTDKPVKLPIGMKSTLRVGARSAKWAAHTLNKVGDGLGWLGMKTAGGILKATGLENPEEGSHKHEWKQTAQAAAVGASHVWQSLEEAGYLVVTSARDNVAVVAKHKYGDEVADATKHSMNAAVYSVDAATALSARAVARRAAKKAAKGALQRM